jgi:hypothetical protein
LGYKNCYGSISRVLINKGDEKVLIIQDTNLSTIKPDSSVFIKRYIKLNGFIHPNGEINKNISLIMEVIPLWQSEFYSHNNIISTDVVVKSVHQYESVEMYADGIKILGGEYVKKNPEIRVKYSGKNEDAIPVNFCDTSLFKLFINNKLFQYNNQISGPVTKMDIVNEKKNSSNNNNDAVKKGKEIQSFFVIYPELQEGENIINIFSKIGYKNGLDSLKYSIFVSNEFFVKDFYNFPNPMNSETIFMFSLAGNSVFDCKIKIYTVSGKLIKTLYAPVNIGFNRVRWDGRDDDGDAVANGVYLFKLIVEGDGKKETPIQKLVVLK